MIFLKSHIVWKHENQFVNRTKKTLAVLTITPKNYIKNNLEIYNLVLEETSNILEKLF